MARSLRFYGDGKISRWSLANHSNSESFLVAHIAQRRWTLVRGILGSGRTHSVSFQPFPNSSGWWWLISFIFLMRISCHKTTHAGAWPGWAVSISVLPLTVGWHQRLTDVSLSKHWEIVKEISLACCSPWDHKESDKTVTAQQQQEMRWSLTPPSWSGNSSLYNSPTGHPPFLSIS